MKLTAHPLADALPTEAGEAAPPTDQQLMLRLRVSLARLLAKGDQLPVTFYALLFAQCPTIRRLFPADMTQQRAKLTRTLVWIATHLDRRDQVIAAVRELGCRHARYGATPEHYPLVRDALIDAMARTAGDDWDERIAEDWRLSIDLIARHMIRAAAATTPVPLTPA
jgi:hemoglobin-like flavoprotein